MNIVLLSGGSGKRLWPLSNDIRSKQFIKIFKNSNNEYESMLQRVYSQIKAVDGSADITIATSKSQVSSIHNQLGENVGICVEPCRRDTFPAIALAISYLKDIKKVDENEVVVICPVDPFVDCEYFSAIKSLARLAENGDSNLSLLGIEPTYPSEKYGYIIPENDNLISKVTMFKEKPTKELAEEYISKGALWNAGVFALKIKYVLDIAHKLIDFDDYHDLYNKYDTLKKISFDYAVVEHEDNISIQRFSGKWKDLGTWNTLTEVMDENSIGNVVLNDTCENTHVINEMDVPILCMGLKNTIVSASPDGIIVSDKEQSSYIKPYVDSFDNEIMFAEKSWGNYRVIDIEEESLTIKVTLNPNNKMNYHSHQYRDEVWTVISGKGKTIINDIERNVSAGDIINIPANTKHTIIAETELQIIEVQLGKDITVHDKIKYD